MPLTPLQVQGFISPPIWQIIQEVIRQQSTYKQVPGCSPFCPHHHPSHYLQHYSSIPSPRSLSLTSSTHIPPLGRMAASDKPWVNGHLIRVCVRLCVRDKCWQSRSLASYKVSICELYQCVRVCACVRVQTIYHLCPPCHVRTQQMLWKSNPVLHTHTQKHTPSHEYHAELSKSAEVSCSVMSVINIIIYGP